MRMADIWVVDDDQSLRWVVQKALELAGFAPRAFSDAESCLDALSDERPAVLVTDVRMKGQDGIRLLAQVRELDDPPPVIVVTAHSDFDSAVTAYEAGAFEYLPKPFDIDELTALVKRAADSRKGAGASAGAAVKDGDLPTLLGEAPAMQEVFRAVGRLARTRMTVLITGESGTGKELIARALHRHSPAANQPFVALNTAAIPTELLESELFGHERGSFTGATDQRRGRFEQADGGTLFLDEIGDMPMGLQTRLLRVLAEGEFYRVGGTESVKVDTRVIAATHQDLEALVKQGKFREDLYHRLNVVRIRIPALRERTQDVPAMAEHFLKDAAKEMNVPLKRLTPEVVKALQQHRWPGNVRELRNLCRRLTALAPGRELHLSDLKDELEKSGSETESFSGTSGGDWSDALRIWARDQLASGKGEVGVRAIEKAEQVLIEAALEHTKGAKAEAAVALGWGRNTLTRKLK
jgi:two-component system nitrogen regulation response regulator GlnG